MRDGIEDVHSLGLNAMEVQMVRVNVIDRFPDEEEVGLTPLEVAHLMWRIRGEGEEDKDHRPERGDTEMIIASGLVQNSEVRDPRWEELDVELSIHPLLHGPGLHQDLTERCIDNIR